MDWKFFLLVASICISHPKNSYAQTNLRGWFDAGQTWLVWEDTSPFPETYRIYKSSEQITSIAGAELAGRIFQIEGAGNRLRKLSDAYRWKIPDGNGGVYTLKDNEALFVYTPHVEMPLSFAVVRDDNDIISSVNRVGPIEQVIGTIRCHLQASGSEDDFPFRVYAHWIDGGKHLDSGRVDYPLMGNEHLNGTGRLFRIWEYPVGEITELIPLSIVLHGGGGWYGNFCPCRDDAYKTYLVNSMVFCPDDGITAMKSGQVKSLKTYWIGHWEGYNRFLPPEDQPIPDTGLVVDYTMRRMLWEINWLIDSEEVDAERISLMGGSMGARGANYLARAFPERFAAWLSLSPGIVPQPDDPLVGSVDQNLKTNLPGAPGVLKVMDLHTSLSASERDIPFGKIVGGRNDNSLAALTPEVVQAYKDINISGYGSHIYWDDRGHVFTGGSYWSDSEKLTSQTLTSFRSCQSFPAFYNDDQDFTMAGRQPDIGTGNSDGDPWGTWGGYYDWDPGTIIDEPSMWKAEVFLLSSSDYANDIPPFDSSMTDLAIRKPQQFKPPEGSNIAWELIRKSDSRVIKSGQEIVGEDGVVFIPGLIIYKERCELSISVAPTSVITGKELKLQVSPNPFEGIAKIEYEMHEQGMVNIAIYNISGQLVKILVNEYKIAGKYSIRWDAGDLTPGLYFCKIKTPQETDVERCILTLRTF